MVKEIAEKMQKLHNLTKDNLSEEDITFEIVEIFNCVPNDCFFMKLEFTLDLLILFHSDFKNIDEIPLSQLKTIKDEIKVMINNCKVYPIKSILRYILKEIYLEIDKRIINKEV